MLQRFGLRISGSALIAARRTATQSSMPTLAGVTGQENLQPAKLQKMSPPMEQLRVKKLSEHATLPKRGSAGAAGYDLAR